MNTLRKNILVAIAAIGFAGAAIAQTAAVWAKAAPAKPMAARAIKTFLRMVFMGNPLVCESVGVCI